MRRVKRGIMAGMESLHLAERVSIANRILSLKAEVRAEVSGHLQALDPDPVALFEACVRRQGQEDADYHLDHLAAAVASGSLAAFETYVRWIAFALCCRGADPRFVEASLDRLEYALTERLDTAGAFYVAELIAAGRRTCHVLGRVPETETSEDLDIARMVFQQAILQGERHAALNAAVEALYRGFTAQRIYLEIVQPSLYDVGRLWQKGAITVAQEHMATAVAQFVLAQMATRFEPAASRRGKMVVTGVQGELHQVGVGMVADLFAADGWEVRFLGTDIPHAEIVRALEVYKPDVLGVSATILPSLSSAIRLIGLMRQQLGDDSPQVLLGGRAFREAAELGSELGAAGVALDLEEALALTRQIRARS